MADGRSDVSIYSSIFNSNADGVVIVNPARQILYWNPRMEQLFGRKSDEVTGMPVRDILVFQEKASFLRNISNSIEGRANASELAYVPENLPGLQFTISFSPIGSLTGENDNCLLLLHLSHEQLTMATFENWIRDSPLAMSLYGRKGNALMFNSAYSDMWDVPFSAAERTFLKYNILEDEQLKESTIYPFICQAFEGEMVELPVIAYNPANTESLKELGKNEERFVKGFMFPVTGEDPEKGAVLLILQDLTDQKKSESIVLENEQKLQALAMGVPGVIYEYHIPFESDQPYFNYVSQRIGSLFGLTSEEVLKNANTLFDLVHPMDRDNLFESLNKTEQVDKYWVWSGRFIINGEIKWIESKSSPGIIRDDRIIRYGLMLDITDRKAIEDAHKRTEERLRIALEAADLGFWEWDVLEKRKIFNPSWAYRFGYTDEEAEALYANWEALIHPKDLPDVKKKLNRYLKKQSDLYEAEYRFKMADGSYRWVHDRGSGIAMDQESKIIRATGTYVDIHEKKESENRIRRQEQLFTHLFENSPVGIVFLDENLLVRQANPGFSEIFGWKIDDLVGTSLDEKIVPEDMIEESESINRSTRSGRPQKLETYRLNAENELVPVIIYSIPVIYLGQTIGIYGLYVDITDRVKVEKELEVRNLELDNFVYKVSHDLRAPLSSIMGLVNLVNHERGSDTVYDYIDMIENRIKQLDHFISDILSHSKNLKLDVKYSKIDFNTIIEDCFSSISYLPQTSRIRKDITIRGGDFYSDHWRISEILRNLISNAVKYYSTRRDEPFIEIEIMVERTYASIYFGDNGIGITGDRLPKVFEMFYRATELGEGSGIGLYIVKNAIERLGGVIRIRSEANKGTSFEITLPNAIREIEDKANTA